MAPRNEQVSIFSTFVEESIDNIHSYGEVMSAEIKQIELTKQVASREAIGNDVVDFNMRSVDLGRLNSLTKYPSIPTYHSLDPSNGNLLEEHIELTSGVIVTEKVDGTNTRIILLPDGNYILGSREELLYARGDLIGNPALGIVEAVKGVAERACEVQRETSSIVVLYGEVYGGKVTGASKQYTGERAVGFRLFDAATIETARLAMEPGQISTWREQGGQAFLPELELQKVSAWSGVPLTPRLLTLAPEELPHTVEETASFLKGCIEQTLCSLDIGAGGQPEGVVIRTANRSQIAKLRFEDYARTLRRRK